MYKIMIVEDDMTIASVLNDMLTKWGFSSFYITDFTDIIGPFEREEPQLVLLDISLPFYNGYYWCGELRKRSKVPIVFISSNTAGMDIVMAMNMGGDDFITKPFDLNVVIAKLQAILRRTYDYQEAMSILTCRGGVLNLSETCFYYQDRRIDLTRNEFRILKLLMEHKNNIVSRDQLMQGLWDDDCFIDDNTLTVNVARLRKKLEDIGLAGYITTKKGLGYRISEEDMP